MKQQVKIATAICMLCTMTAAGTVFANPANQYPVNKVFFAGSSMKVDLKWRAESQILVLVVDNPATNKISVVLRSASGVALKDYLFAKREKSVQKYYSFSEAEAGDYSMEISDGISTISKKINLVRVEQKETTVMNIH
jgi:hypothetical protein